MPETEDASSLWDEVLAVVRQEVSEVAFTSWFSVAKAVDVTESALIVGVPTTFVADWLTNRYSSLVHSALERCGRPDLRVAFVRDGDGTPRAQPDETDLGDGEERGGAEEMDTPAEVDGSPHGNGGFNLKYTFESFVLGESNRFAHAAAQAVAEAPGRAYNPLFIYGGVGLGKTHLLHAIGHYVNEHMPFLRVKYVSTEQFTNDFINSLNESGRIEGFRRQYRTNDVLLVDDVQFLMGKKGTQEEVFHTFNTLQQAGKQIVLTSDRPPRDIATLEERLRSRFEMGLITDIQPPNIETRIAILRKRCESDGTPVPDDVLSFIAEMISTNIRELEGALIKVVAFASLTGKPITPDIARSVLGDISQKPRQTITTDLIQRAVCRYYGVSRTDLVSAKRSQSIVFPRQVAMYLSRELTDLSLPVIGAAFGGKDHATVVHACKKIQRLLNEEPEVYKQVHELTNRIKNGDV